MTNKDQEQTERSVVGSLMLRLLDLDNKVLEIERLVSPATITILRSDVAYLKKIVEDNGDKAIVSMLDNIEERLERVEGITKTNNARWTQMDKWVKRIFYGVLALLGGTGLEHIPKWLEVVVDIIKKMG